MDNPDHSDIKKEVPALKKSEEISNRPSTSRTSLVELPPDERKTYLDAALEREAKDLEGASIDQVGHMLAVVAGMIGCPIPPPPVLAKYIEMLTEYPADLVEIGGTFVLKRHKWNTFPKVAEFIEPLLEEYHERQAAYRQTERLYESFVGEKPPALSAAAAPRSGRGPRRLGQALIEMKKERQNG
jgi:hypothetical protein